MKTLLSLMLLSSVAVAQGDPLELARGLRDRGQPDLSLEYLDYIAAGNPTEDVKVVLALERAKTVLAVAQLETEEAVRDVGIGKAKAEFENFIAANPKHVRVVEAQLALAQVASMQAGRLMNAARNIRIPEAANRDKPNENERKMQDEASKRKTAAVMEARKAFGDAAENFEKAAANLKTQMTAPGLQSPRKRELQKTSLMAELDRGVNSFRLVETYSRRANSQERPERLKKLDETRKIFADLAKADANGAVGWQAKAWMAMCDHEKGDVGGAAKQFAEIKKEAGKSAAGADGQRQVEFFEVLIKYDDVKSDFDQRKKPDVNTTKMARTMAKTWLDKDRYKLRMTPQRLSMTYYYALLTEVLGLNEVVYEKLSDADIKAGKTPKPRPVNAQGIAYFKEAARSYKVLTDFDNEYTARAIDGRGGCVTYIVGDKPKDPKDYTDLEECQMASQIQLDLAETARMATADAEKAGDAAKIKAAKDKEKVEFDKAIALVEKAKSLTNAKTPPREVAETNFNRASAYFTAGQYAKAAEFGEEMARNTKGSFAARGAYVAIESYLRQWDAIDKGPQPADEAAQKKRADDMKALRDKAVALAQFIDKTFTVSDTFTDVARLRAGQLMAEDGNLPGAFDILSRIGPTFPELLEARILQGRIAYQMLTNEENPLDAKKRDEVFKKVTRDLAALGKPLNPESLRSYFTARTLLASLYLTADDKAALESEKISNDVIKQANESKLPPAEKQGAMFSAEETRLYAVKTQARKLFETGKYDDMGKKMMPILLEIKKEGSAAAKADGEAKAEGARLDGVRTDFIFFAIQGRIREGKFDVAAELFEVLEKLGGNDEMMAVQLNRIVSQVRPHVERLRKEKKNDEADKVSGGIGTLLRKQADKQSKKHAEKIAELKAEKAPERLGEIRSEIDQIVGALSSLGSALRNLGQYEKAVEVLKLVVLSKEDAAKIFENTAGNKLTPEEAERIRNWQFAQLELARAYRAMRKFDEADKIMKSALGDAKAKPATKGWARSLEFRKEAIYLLEEKAMAVPADQAKARQTAWVEAKEAWEELASTYVSVLSLPVRNENDEKKEDPKAKKQDTITEQERDKIVPVYVEILYDYRRCLVKAWSALLTDAGKLNAKLIDMAAPILEIEKQYPKAMTPDVKEKFAELLTENPTIKNEYKKLGGQAFLDGK